jgi:hypothetical protein
MVLLDLQRFIHWDIASVTQVLVFRKYQGRIRRSSLPAGRAGALYQHNAAA